MAFSKLVEAFRKVWSAPVAGPFADNEFENVNPQTFRDFTDANAELHDRGANAQRGLHKRFRYLTQAEVVANGNEGTAFESLDYDTCCVGTQIIVQYYQPDPLVPATRDQVLVAAYDHSGKNFIYSDGSFRPGDRIAPAKFVPAAQGQYGYVRRDTFPPSIKDWRVEELSLWELSGVDEFATAKQAGGPWPAFTGVDDAYWKPASPPQVNSYTRQQLDALLAGKQPALREVEIAFFFFTTGTLSRTYLNKRAEVSTSYRVSTITLPTVTVADAGATMQLYVPIASASDGLTRFVDPNSTFIVGLYQLESAVLSVVVRNNVARWVLVAQSSQEVIACALGDIRNRKIDGSLNPMATYVVSDQGWIGGQATVYVQALDLTRLSPFGAKFNSVTGQLDPVVVDVPAGTFGPVGGGYSDAQARAAQLGRVAPAGATTITLTAESPRDYGTAASGTFTIDATGAVQDAGASFRLAAGATAPIFQNAPAGRPFVQVGEPYIPGLAWGYSVLVLADCIEVVIYAR